MILGPVKILRSTQDINNWSVEISHPHLWTTGHMCMGILIATQFKDTKYHKLSQIVHQCRTTMGKNWFTNKSNNGYITIYSDFFWYLKNGVIIWILEPWNIRTLLFWNRFLHFEVLTMRLAPFKMLGRHTIYGHVNYQSLEISHQCLWTTSQISMDKLIGTSFKDM
jgi:hypothetical protein